MNVGYAVNQYGPISGPADSQMTIALLPIGLPFLPRFRRVTPKKDSNSSNRAGRRLSRNVTKPGELLDNLMPLFVRSSHPTRWPLLVLMADFWSRARDLLDAAARMILKRPFVSARLNSSVKAA